MIRRILLAAIASLALAGSAAAQFPGYPASGNLQIGQGSTAPPAWNPLNGDCTSTHLGAIVCTKTNGVTFYTGLPAPVNTMDAATKQYVDNAVSAGLVVHPSVILATTTALPANTYNNGTAGVGATLTSTCVSSCPAPTIDGTAATLGIRVLVDNEAAPANNGIYTVTTVGTGTTPYVLTRATDANTPGTNSAILIGMGTFVVVTGGSTGIGQGWTVNSTVTTIGTSAINWAQFSSTGGGVSSLGGMIGSIACGAGLICASGTASSVIPVNYIGGLVLSNDISTPNTVLDSAAGLAADSTNAVMISIGAFTKSIAGAWAANSGSNGMGNGLTVAASTWYHVCLANNSGTPDEWFDTSATCVNRPAGISDTKYRRIGSFRTNASSHITAFSQFGNDFLWTTPLTDVNGTVGVGVHTATLTVPLGVIVYAKFNASIAPTLGSEAISFYSVGFGPPSAASLASVNSQSAGGQFMIRTNTSSQIATDASNNLNTVISTAGWVDNRGQ